MDSTKVVREEEKVVTTNKRVEITEDNPHVLICVYGTLRTGQGNHAWLLKGKAECLGTFKSEPAFTMYGRRGPYPSVVPTGTTSIEYEVFKVSDSKVLNGLHSLEGCNGIPGDPKNTFYDIMPMDTPVGQGWIYIRKDYKADESSVIATGNWLNKSI